MALSTIHTRSMAGNLVLGGGNLDSAEAPFHVVASIADHTDGTIGLIENSNNGGNRGIQFGVEGSGSQTWPYIQSYHSQSTGNYWELLLNPYGGNVGIGTTDPTGLLDIEGSGATQYINSTSGNSNLLFQLNGTTTGSIEVGGGNAVYITANNASGHLYLRTGGANTRMFVSSSGDVGINTTVSENTNGTELNIKGGTNNSKPAVITLQGGASDGAGYVQTEVFGISSITSATEITRITGTGSNGFRMLIYVTATGHTGAVGNGHHIGKYYWDGGTNTVTGIAIDQSHDNYPQITFDTSTSNVCIVKLTSHDGSNGFNGVMEVKWYVPIDFASNTWQVS